MTHILPKNSLQRLLLLLFSLIFLIYLPISVNAAVTSPWSMFRHDSYRSGRTDIIGPSKGILKWKFQLDSNAWYSSPSIGADGTIYMGSYSGKTLYAIDPNGTLKWTYQLGGDIHYATPLIAVDGTIYIAAFDHKLYAINPDGTEKWTTVRLDGPIGTSPAIASDGTIYVASGFFVYAFHSDGTPKWQYPLTWQVTVWSSPLVGPDGIIYIGVTDGTFHAINPDGTKRWTVQLTPHIPGMPYRSVTTTAALSPDGTLYVGDDTGTFYALNSLDGSIKWSFIPSGSILISSPAIRHDGNIVMGATNGKTHLLNPMGAVLWMHSHGGGVIGSPLVDGSDVTYVASNDGVLHAIDNNGTPLWIFQLGWSTNSSPALDSHGVLYIGSEDGYLYAIQGNDTLPPSITINSPKGVVSTQTVPIDVSITDPSGLASYSYFVDGDEIPNSSTSINLSYFQPGDHIFKVEATDGKGNTSSETATFTYSPTTASIRDGIDQMYQDGEITKLGDSLYDKLDQAQIYINNGQYDLARETLSALMNEIEAQMGKKIDANAGHILIEQVKYLINTLPLE